MLAAQGFEQLAGLGVVELWVSGLDADVKLVMSHVPEAVAVEQRVIPAGQAIEEQHAAQRTERAEQDRHLVTDREAGQWTEERLAPDDDLVVVSVHIPDHQHAERHAGAAKEEREPADLRVAQAHRGIQAVEGVGRINVPASEAGIADLLSGGEGPPGRIELREETELGRGL